VRLTQTFRPTTASTTEEILQISDSLAVCDPFHTSSIFNFLAEADRLEAGGFNLVIDIKKCSKRCQIFD
jgi:hypothetical protein